MQKKEEKNEYQSDDFKLEIKQEQPDSTNNHQNNKDLTYEQESKSSNEKQSTNQLTPEDDLIAQFEKISIKDQPEQIQDNKQKEIPQVQTEENVQIIKGTQRPDGTFRKDIKVKPGYKNDEMIKKYVIPQKR